jgi:hypothetical protein
MTPICTAHLPPPPLSGSEAGAHRNLPRTAPSASSRLLHVLHIVSLLKVIVCYMYIYSISLQGYMYTLLQVPLHGRSSLLPAGTTLKRERCWQRQRDRDRERERQRQRERETETETEREREREARWHRSAPSSGPPQGLSLSHRPAFLGLSSLNGPLNVPLKRTLRQARP